MSARTTFLEGMAGAKKRWSKEESHGQLDPHRNMREETGSNVSKGTGYIQRNMLQPENAGFLAGPSPWLLDKLPAKRKVEPLKTQLPISGKVAPLKRNSLQVEKLHL